MLQALPQVASEGNLPPDFQLTRPPIRTSKPSNFDGLWKPHFVIERMLDVLTARLARNSESKLIFPDLVFN